MMIDLLNIERRFMKALFTHTYGERNMKKIEDLGIDITYIPEKKIKDGYLVSDYDFLVCYDPFPSLRFEGNKLKWIQLTSKGVAHVPDFLRTPAIQITNNKNASAIPIAESIIGYIMYIYKNFETFRSNKGVKLWKPNTDLLELTGKTVTILGTGEIAKATAERLHGFGVTILGINTDGRMVDGFSKVYKMEALEEVLAISDIIISILPSTDKTYHILNKKSLSYTKQGSVLINISRGSILDEASLIELLDKDHFRGVALDVVETEPLPPSSPLWNYDKLFLTPHSSFFSDQYKQRIFNMIYENVKNFLHNQPMNNIVDFQKGY